MIELLKQMILSGQHFTTSGLINRQLQVEPVAGRITVIQGARKCGKSAVQLQLMEKLFRSGVSKQSMIHIDFSDSRLRILRRSQLNIIFKAYQELYPNHNYKKEKLHLFLDEVQHVNNWPIFILELKQSIPCEFYLTASTLTLFEREDAKALVPLCDSYEIYPFSFNEFLQVRGVTPHDPPQDKERAILKHMFASYMDFGGFPAIQMLNDDDARQQRLQAYVSGTICSELFQSYHINDPLAFSDFIHHLLSHSSQTFTCRQLVNYLKSYGHNADEEIVLYYMRSLKDFYFITGMDEMTEIQEPTTSRDPHWRIFAIDHALARAVSPETNIRMDGNLRNVIYVILCKAFNDVYYYRCRSGDEVDFYIPKNSQGPATLIQVHDQIEYGTSEWTASTNAIAQGLMEINVKQGYLVVNNDETRTWIVNGKVIQQIPAYIFILSLNSLKDKITLEA